MEDLIEQANEIQESLGRSYGVPDEVDEADLQAGTSLRMNIAFRLTILVWMITLLRLTLYLAELDALGLDDEPIGENETPSYLQDSMALPDFVDSAPVEENHVSLAFQRAFLDCWIG